MSRQPKVYIAGPMSGLPDFNYPAFAAEAELWCAAGWAVLNPASNGADGTDKPYSDFIRAGLRMLLEADAVAMLPGWQNSRGATLEHRVAEVLDLPIWDDREDSEPRWQAHR